MKRELMKNREKERERQTKLITDNQKDRQTNWLKQETAS